ncbi:hypothetical protein [Arthrobacter sp. PAMC25564]|uniref:hypothetical protein n=1 Tax=Arthrobacter sp. PAMC25564 TaxID=2565366 RepID=UPI001F0F177E|nr:hypothetical protein [Arthrobacter sp. PAMC25564]
MMWSIPELAAAGNGGVAASAGHAEDPATTAPAAAAPKKIRLEKFTSVDSFIIMLAVPGNNRSVLTAIFSVALPSVESAQPHG